MDPRIGELKTTTFSGRRPTRRQIAQVQETVSLLPGNVPQRVLQDDPPAPRLEVGEGLLQGRCRPGDAGRLERHGILKPPPKREGMDRKIAEKPVWIPTSDLQPAISAPLSELEPVRLEIADDAVHPEHRSRPAFGWFPKGTRPAVGATSGRRRLNPWGAFNLEEMRLSRVEGERVDGETTVRPRLPRQRPLQPRQNAGAAARLSGTPREAALSAALLPAPGPDRAAMGRRAPNGISLELNGFPAIFFAPQLYRAGAFFEDARPKKTVDSVARIGH